MFIVSSCSCLCLIHWSQVLSRKWWRSWSCADRRCSYYIWMMNNFITQVRFILEVWRYTQAVDLVNPDEVCNLYEFYKRCSWFFKLGFYFLFPQCCFCYINGVYVDGIVQNRSIHWRHCSFSLSNWHCVPCHIYLRVIALFVHNNSIYITYTMIWML